MLGLSPGGYYEAIWCRDAAYILRDWLLSGNASQALQQAFLIWSHQIEPGKEILIFGRGSPDMKFTSETAAEHKEREFAGALPTTIYPGGFSEVYAQNPDIDSSALMISATSWILLNVLKEDGHLASFRTNALEHPSDYLYAPPTSEIGITDSADIVVDIIVHKMLKAVDYLARHDADNDGLLEQGHNEDWMDTALRAGKIVYSQACWILALKDLSTLLLRIGKDDEARRTIKMANKAIWAVEKNLWSEGEGCYIDTQQSSYIGGPFRMLTQDVAMYLVAVTDPTPPPALNGITITNDSQEPTQGENTPDQVLIYERANRTLDAIRSRVWKDKRPLVTEVELKHTGPGFFKPYYYHNQAFWPWTTGIEMLARGRLGRGEECDILLSALTSDNDLHRHALCEWVNPITNEGNGAFPFRTGISAVRIAVSDILEKLKPKPGVVTVKNS